MNLGAQRYAVYGPGEDDPLIIDAENWVFALGTALELLEREDWVSRLSCEVHPDGTVVAEDRVTGSRYLVHRVPYHVPESVIAKHRLSAASSLLEAGSDAAGRDTDYVEDATDAEYDAAELIEAENTEDPSDLRRDAPSKDTPEVL